MSRITKDAAELIAGKKLQPKYDAIKQRKIELGAECDKIRIERLPKGVVEIFEKYHSKGVGINFQTDNSKVCNKGGCSAGWYGSYLPGESTIVSDSMFEKAIAIKSDENKLDETKQLLMDTIYSLRTYAKVAEHFPELVECFPSPDQPKNELVNFNQLRELIKHP